MTVLHYWDACTFLALLQNEDGREAACRDTIERARRQEILILSSALTVAEVLWTKNGPRLDEDKADILNRFFRRSSFRIVNLDRRIAEDAQRLVWKDGIRPKDSVHVATARRRGCPIFETYDDGLLTKDGLFADLTIREPQSASQGSLGL